MAVGQHGNVFQHGLAAIAEPRGFDRGDLQSAAQLVDDERRQRFALHILRDDQQRPAALHHGFQNWEHRLQIAKLLFVQENVGVFQFGAHLVGIGDEIG